MRGANLPVVVAGNLVLDHLAWPVEKIRWDGTVWVERFTRALGGNGASTSYTLAHFGLPVALRGAVGKDEDGDELVARLGAVGVDTGAIARLDYPTPATMALVRRSGARAFVHRPGASKHSLTEPIVFDAGRQRHFHLANPFSVIALRQASPGLLGAAKAAGLTTSLDLGWDSRGEWGSVVMPCLPQVDVLFLNAEEARLTTGERSEKKALAALRAAGARTVVVKRGRRGALVAGEGFAANIPAFAVEVIDSTGAGDVFAGAFLAAWLKGFTMPEAARFANGAAALSVTALGATAGLRPFAETLAWMRERDAATSSGGA